MYQERRRHKYATDYEFREKMKARTAKYRVDRPGYYTKYMRERYRSSDIRRQHQKDLLFKRKYRISLADYANMLTSQAGKCAACGDPPTGKGTHGGVPVLAVDHDHVTGEVRGLLCANCNKALGYLKDDPERCFKLAAYVSATPVVRVLKAV